MDRSLPIFLQEREREREVPRESAFLGLLRLKPRIEARKERDGGGRGKTEDSGAARGAPRQQKCESGFPCSH